MNKAIIVGRLTKDPDLRTTQRGTSVCQFTVAVNRNFKNEAGEYESDFPTCKAFGKTAEFVGKYFKKGDMIGLEGSLRTGKYQDKNHPDVTHYTTDVAVDNVEFVGGKEKSPAQNLAKQAQAAEIPGGYEEILNEGDMPF